MDQDLIEKIVQEVIRRLKAEMGVEAAAKPPRKVIVEADVLEAVRRGEKVIRAAPKVIITPLARDAMREKGVRVEVVKASQNDE
ncbi:MAG: hypothetical protein A3F84_26585 [Candidatus Handelsmanbacteria bacterium RIFCSPLOWO2_12_FULL_64_10]|uniref:Uncharacterized protein n=1 Tax=Handelsmanbacteria sp. (strain RIFCSPLOWO2_12_FULL_64_10) TaxID=1817868 RepID=A0A1F6CQW1_HANXR|nr:MAG: hypothetical protein A3F84_26585 [Candidatus Handelsmanbacteria bacterium RIFCSPLOWO2_12_FULL_64_10]